MLGGGVSVAGEIATVADVQHSVLQTLGAAKLQLTSGQRSVVVNAVKGASMAHTGTLST